MSSVKQAVVVLFESLCLFPAVIIKLVVAYWAQFIWENKIDQVWILSQDFALPSGLTTDGTYLYICDYGAGSLLTYTFNGILVPHPSPSLSYPRDIDWSSSSGQLYVADCNYITVLNSEKKVLAQWPLPPVYGNYLKVDGDYIYLTLLRCHQIYIHSKKNGTLIKTYGIETKSDKEGEFNEPYGITTDKQFLYVCDHRNHRIQALNKTDGTFSHRWGSPGSMNGEFRFPAAIQVAEGVVYVGDEYAIQLFTRMGKFIKRLGQTEQGQHIGYFRGIYGLLLHCDRLYVSDFNNRRIQVFMRHLEQDVPSKGFGRGHLHDRH